MKKVFDKFENMYYDNPVFWQKINSRIDKEPKQNPFYDKNHRRDFVI